MTRLLFDVMLGKLARYARLCGYDAAYALDRGIEADSEVLALARTEDRRIVTRDHQVSAQADEPIHISATDILDQLRELEAAGLELRLTEPAYCGQCNGRLQRVGDEETTPDYAPTPSETAVWACTDCGQFFWQGSHWDDVAQRLARL